MLSGTSKLLPSDADFITECATYRTRMADAVRCLKDLSRECQKLFEDAVGGPALAGDCINALAMFNSRTGLRGMEAISRNTADSFALSNYPYWLKELHCAYDLDTSGKLSALEQLRYSGAGVQVVCEQWRVQPGPQGGVGTLGMLVMACIHRHIAGSLLHSEDQTKLCI